MSKHTTSAMDCDALANIRPAMEKHIGDDGLAGAVTLIHRSGEQVYCDALGLLDRERDKPMPEDAIFRIYSMTKPITCVALMMLYEKGRFQLSDPVSKYIPSYKNMQVLVGDEKRNRTVKANRPMTVHDLLTHTSGLSYHFATYGAVEQMYRDAGVCGNQTLEQFAEDLAQLPLAFHPGTEWRYSVSQDVAAHLVQVLSDQTFAEYLRTNLFEPLHMPDTGFYVAPSKLQRFAAMYGARDALEPSETGAELDAAAKAGVNVLLSDPQSCLESKPHNVFRGGHGLVSTAHDYLRFCRMLLGNGRLDGQRFLSRKTVELMTCNHIDDSLLPLGFQDGPTPGVGYGLGFGVVMDPGKTQIVGSRGEYYWSGAATTSFWIDPSEELIGIQMAQFQPSGFHLIAEDFKVVSLQCIDD